MSCTTCRPLSETILLACACTKTDTAVHQAETVSDSGSELDSKKSNLSPDPQNLLRTTFRPQTASELVQINCVLQTAEASLTSLDSDIAHVQRVLSTLFTKRTALQYTITSHKSLLAPIRRLPNELLSEIFLSRASSRGSKNSSSTIQFTNFHNDSLWSILQVCSLWRKTAQSTPQLWNTLYIDLTPLKGKFRAYNHLFARLSTCLKNFLPTALPLNFAITGTHYQHSSHLFPLISALCVHSDRWGKVYFCPYTTNLLANWNFDAKFQNISSPRLTALGLTSFNPTPGFIQTPTQFAYTPQLRKLALHDYHPLSGVPDLEGGSSTFLPSFCRQLTHLYLDSCPFSTYADILSCLPRLRRLEILNKHHHLNRSSPGDSSTSITTTTTTTTPHTTQQRQLNIHLPELRTLKITGWLNNLCFLLPQMDLPLIEGIDIVALTEQCHPCTCAVVKMRIVNEWVGTLRKGVAVVVDHRAAVSLREVKGSTDDGIVEFLFADD